MEFKIALAMYEYELCTIDIFPEIAICELEKGEDTPSLRILAGESDPDEIHKYLKRTLKELNIIIPNKREATFILIKCYLEQIVNKEIDPNLALGTIISKILYKSQDLFTNSKKYAYDSIGFEKLFGYYDDYDDITNLWASCRNESKINTQIAELNEKIYQESINWIENYLKFQ